MSISSIFHRERRGFSLRLPSLNLRALLPARGAKRSNRIDRDHLPESLQRDIGLLDVRSTSGCHPAWRAAVFSVPPRGL